MQTAEAPKILAFNYTNKEGPKEFLGPEAMQNFPEK